MISSFIYCFRWSLFLCLFFLLDKYCSYSYLLETHVILIFFIFNMAGEIIFSRLNLRDEFRIVMDALLLIILMFQTIIMIYWMYRAPGEAGFGFFAIVTYIPLYICISIFLYKDVNKRQNKFKG